VLAHVKPASAFEQLRNLAVSRIYLDNIDHLTAYWVSMGLPLAQVSLSYGVDDLHGTILEEKIFHMAGATTPQVQTVETLKRVIREAGREPVQRDSYYRHIVPRMAQNQPKRNWPAPRCGKQPSRLLWQTSFQHVSDRPEARLPRQAGRMPSSNTGVKASVNTNYIVLQPVAEADVFT